MVAMERKAFPDLHMEIDDMIAEGDKMAVRYTYTGTFKGDFMGIPPTGKKFNMPHAMFYRFKDGKQAEVAMFLDMLSWYRQLGVPIPQQ